MHLRLMKRRKGNKRKLTLKMESFRMFWREEGVRRWGTCQNLSPMKTCFSSLLSGSKAGLLPPKKLIPRLIFLN
jgi:hypothetical protein